MADLRTGISVQRERAILTAALLPDLGLDERHPLAELGALAETAGAQAVGEVTQARQRPDPSTFIGSGKVDELAGLAKLTDADVVIFENDLSPAQLRNVEQVVERKVIDRSELILDIFASRARTHEARLQVELAQLEYTYPRLRAMWSHLERIAGGAPAGIGTRGPGEQQLEIDRRIVQRRTAELRREIERIQGRKQREVAQRNTDFFTVGLVGYTNAGKSTLFNTLTAGDVYADDRLFATLDTRTRRWDLGGGDGVMLSDTVGFVRHLPHHLVASFRATLEESIHSDLLLIVLDVSDPESPSHADTVAQVLAEIGAADQPRLVLLNKIDRLEDQAALASWAGRNAHALPVSARAGLGLDRLVEAVRSHQRGAELELTLRLSMQEGKAMGFLENRSTVHDRRYDTTHVDMDVRIGKRQLDQLRATGAKFDIVSK
ncbi:MAG: GTPase HflX [Planctomycetes bacterium]|jgi:GTP-binding protein HflX|nr:GTPase HflX [Planctomycetota bacterium]